MGFFGLTASVWRGDCSNIFRFRHIPVNWFQPKGKSLAGFRIVRSVTQLLPPASAERWSAGSVQVTMNRSPSRSRRGLQSHAVVKPINFFCNAPQAESVSVVGDFNQWQPSANPMEKQLDGSWQASVDMKHGHHRYAFWVDGVLTLDPKALGITRDDLDNRVSLLSVS